MYLNEERARGLMMDHNIDVLVASTPENVTYIAGTWGWSNKVYVYSVHMFAVYPRDAGTCRCQGAYPLPLRFFSRASPRRMKVRASSDGPFSCLIAA